MKTAATGVKGGNNGCGPLFSERAVLFHVTDTNRCQHLGCGRLDIIYVDNVKGARIRQTSEQNRIICNHIICRGYELKCDSQNKTCEWIAIDFSTGQPKRHHFRVLFDSANCAQDFKRVFDKGLHMANTSCIDEIDDGTLPPGTQQRQKQQDTMKGDSRLGSKRPDESLGLENELDDDSCDFQSFKDEPLFSRRATLFHVEDDQTCQLKGLGELEIVYEEDVRGARITMSSDENKIICNHMICRKHQLKRDPTKNSCEWTALDFSTAEPEPRRFKVDFSSVGAAEEFAAMFKKGLEMANDSRIDEGLDVIIES